MRYVRRSLGSLLCAIALAGAAASPGHAEVPAAGHHLTFDCNALNLPTQKDVGRLAGTQNFGQTYRARERLMQEVRSACRRGAEQVLVEAGIDTQSRTASASPTPR